MSSWSPASGGWSNYIPSKQGVANTVSGLGGVASDVYGAVSNSVPSGQGYLSSLPAGLKRLSDLLPSAENPDHGVGDRDEVVTVAFDQDTGPASHLHFLNVCFRNGFQIWEVLDSDEGGTQATRETQPLREVVSVRQGYTQLVKVLSTVPVSADSPLHNKQPAVAVVSGDEPGDLNVVRIFSLADNDYVDKMRFHGDVHAVLCNRHCIIVCLKNQLILHSMHDMTVLQTLSTFPSPTPQGVVALGARWVAYASNQPLRSAPDDESNTDPSNTYGSAYLDIGVAAASTAASGAMQLGGLGLRTLNSYLGSSPPIAQPPDQPAQYAGTVMVRDLHNHTVVHHFKAHEGAVSIIRFDPSGLLLATAGVDGHNINVFQVNASHDNGKNKSRVPRPPKHLYKLVRGMTSAIIDDLSFSPDTRWISVTTRSRTAHLYAINADGSYASVETHVPSPSIDSAWPLYPMSASYAASTNTPLTLFAVQRIKQREHLPPSVMSRTLSANPTPSAMGSLASSCTRFAIPGNTTSFSQFPAAASGIFMVTGEGVGVVLANYRLTPECKEDPDTLAHTILLDADCQGTMDMCRRRSWREQECNAQRLSSWTKAAQANVKNDKEEQGGMPEWVSNVEIYTHPRGEDAVWGSKHFRFKAFCRGAQGLGPPATGPPGLIEQLQTADVGGACGEMDGAHDPDSEDYFFVQGPGPRTRPAVSPHSWPMCATASPDVLQLNLSHMLQLNVSHSSPGVYGGLPSSLGSSQGTPPLHESRAHAQGREPSGAASYAASYGNSASAGPGGYAYRNDAANRGTLSNAKTSQAATHGLSSHDLPEEEGLFEMDPPTPPIQDKRGWDSDADSDADLHSVSRNSLLPAAPTHIAEAGCGPADTTMTCVFDDDEFGGNDDFFSHKAVANASARGAASAARRSNPIQPLTKPMQSLATSLPDSKALAKAQDAAGCEGLDDRAGAPDSWSGESGHSDTLSHESRQLLRGHASPPKARAHAKGSGRLCHESKDSMEGSEKDLMRGSEKDSMHPASQDSIEAGGPAWHSDNAYDQYDGDGSSKGDNDTPVGSMSPSTAVQALENIKKLNLKLHQDLSPEGAHALSSPDDWDSWGEVALAQVRSPKKPTRSPHKGVLEGGSQCLEHHAAKANTNDSGNREKEDWEKDDCGGVSALWDATAPADAHALSSGLESGDKESGQDSLDEPSSTNKKKKKKKSKK